MNDLKKYIYIHKNLLSDDDCDQLIELFEKSKNKFVEKSANYQTNKINQSGGVLYSVQPEDDEFIICHNKTSKMIEYYSEYLKKQQYIYWQPLISSFKYSHNYRLIKYNNGSFIHDHIDWGLRSNLSGSCTLNLNDDYEGGEFRFFGGEYKIPLMRGDGLIFPAATFYIHGTEKVTSGQRYCVNSFLGYHSERENKSYFNHQISEKYEEFYLKGEGAYE